MAHRPLPAFSATVGSLQPKAILLGEAWGESEERLREPFAGSSGQELTRMLFEAWGDTELELQQETLSKMFQGDLWLAPRREWLKRVGLLLTNVFALRPLGNKLENICAKRKELPSSYPNIHPMGQNLWLREEFFPELERLGRELTATSPNLIIALGNTATWATLQATNIGTIRGAIALSRPHMVFAGIGNGIKVLPTYHPAGVLRQWNWRPIVVADLMKARREMGFSELRRPARRVIVNPTLGEVQEWTRATLAAPPPLLACDCETERKQITCIGFARSRREALIIPFIDWAKAERSYWATAGEESAAWDCVRALLESAVPKLFQNGMYDLQYITEVKIFPRALEHDSMLLHHSMFPEMKKGLGFLGSLYTDESSWKLMRRQKMDTEKRDE